MRKASALLLLAYVLLAGCNTMAGAGKDIQEGGATIQNKAEQHR